MANKTVFVTCGATVPFPRLVDAVLRQELLQKLSNAGFRRVIIQYGKGYGTEFEKRLEGLKCAPTECSLAASALGTTNAELATSFCESVGIEIIGLEYSTKIHDIVRMADLVISHAGTGSILDSLRLGRPLIVCVNDGLMDNHQQQIADQFEGQGYVWACKPNESEICECIRRSQSETLNEFPPAYSAPFESELKNLAFK